MPAITRGVTREPVTPATTMPAHTTSEYLPRNSVDYLAHVEEIIPGWSLEGATEVGDDFAVEFDEPGPDVIFQHLIDGYLDLDVYALSPQQAQDMGWPPYSDDPNPRR